MSEEGHCSPVIPLSFSGEKMLGNLDFERYTSEVGP